jgi:hypothetical protein
VLDELKLIREATPNDKLVLSAFVVRSYFLCDETLVVFVNGNSLNKPVDLFAFGEHVDATLFVEDCFLAFGTAIGEFVFVDDKLGRPWWWHVESLTIFLSLLTGFIVDFILLALFAFCFLLEHHIFPLASRIVDEFIKVHLTDFLTWIQVNPKVFVVENRLDCEVGAVVECVLTTSCWFDKN